MMIGVLEAEESRSFETKPGKRKRSIMNQAFKSPTVLFALLSAALLFLSIPLPLLSSEEEVFRRGILFLLPLVDPQLYFSQIGGRSLSLADPDRIKVIGVGLCELAMVLGSGRALLFLLARCPRRNRRLSPISSSERLFFSFLLGTAAISFYLFWAGFFGIINRSLLIPLVFAALGEMILSTWAFIKQIHILRSRIPRFKKISISPSPLLGLFIFLLVVLYLLAGTIPPYEYDMLEYHAQGAREIFETGRISFFEHNVYLNMPLGAEMFYLLGILLNPFPDDGTVDSLCLGVTAGKFFLAFVPLFTAWGAGLIAGRLCDHLENPKVLSRAVVLAVLAMPGIFQVSANGLIDTLLGLSIVGALYAVTAVCQADFDRRGLGALSFIAGVSVGLGAACKYTGIPFVVLPTLAFFLYLTLKNPGRRNFSGVSLFASGAITAGGGWYFKNFYLTGNPFHPLAFSLFGDRTGTWNHMKNDRWNAVHSSHAFGVSDFFSDVWRIFAENFASMILPLWGILLTICMVGALRHRKKDPVIFLALYILFFFFLWWYSTHRLLRFLVPVLPVIGTVAAILWYRFYEASKTKLCRTVYLVLLSACGLYAGSLALLSTPGLLLPLKNLIDDPDRCAVATLPEIQDLRFGETGSTLLLIGDARAFAYRRVPILYNTCWDNACLARLLPEGDYRQNAKAWTDEEVRTIKTNFREKGIGKVLVDNNEIKRFLSPGNYGLTDEEYMTPHLMERLVKAGVLEEIPRITEDENIKLYRVGD